MASLACTLNPEWFFPDTEFLDEQAVVDLYAKAWTVCRNCPRQRPCLEDGLWDDHGVWGGTTPEERIELRLLIEQPELCAECRLPCERGSEMHRECAEERLRRHRTEERKRQQYECPWCRSPRQSQARSCPCGWKATYGERKPKTRKRFP